jgi:hypothetical protein
MLEADKSGHAVAKVMVLGTDPELLHALALQAVRYAPQGVVSIGPSPAAAADEIRARVLRVVQAVIRAARDRLPRGAATTAAAAVLGCGRGEAAFLAAAPSIALLMAEERMREALVAHRAALHSDLRKHLGALLELRAAERMLAPPRWAALAAANYAPSPEDVAVTAGNASGVREALVAHKSFRMRLVDPSCLMLRCRRSKLAPMFEDCEMVVYALDLGQALPARPPPDDTFGLFEQLKLFEALSGSRWFRKTLVALLVNTAGLDACLESAFQSADPKNAKFIKTRLKAISRQPQQLSPLNMYLTNPGLESKLVENIVRTLADLYLSRNVQKGF